MLLNKFSEFGNEHKLMKRSFVGWTFLSRSTEDRSKVSNESKIKRNRVSCCYK